MEGRQRRSFTDDYKWQAVDLVASSGRSIGSVAKELGLRDSVLRRIANPKRLLVGRHAYLIFCQFLAFHTRSTQLEGLYRPENEQSLYV
jgi:hypothetical protein